MRSSRFASAAAIALTLVVASATASIPAQAHGGYHYAGYRTGNYFTGIWGYIENNNVTLSSPSTNHTLRWIGKVITNGSGAPVQWLQAGNAIGAIGDKRFNSVTSYLEYIDYAGSYQVVSLGAPAETYTEYAVWGDGTSGVDGWGTYYNTHVNFREGPDNVSPVWSTRLAQNWTFNDAVGEMYSDNGTHEPMGNACFGCHSGGSYSFVALGWYSSGSTSWSLWSTSNDNPFFLG